jgi:hypothetical protein
MRQQSPARFRDNRSNSSPCTSCYWFVPLNERRISRFRQLLYRLAGSHQRLYSIFESDKPNFRIPSDFELMGYTKEQIRAREAQLPPDGRAERSKARATFRRWKAEFVKLSRQLTRSERAKILVLDFPMFDKVGGYKEEILELLTEYVQQFGPYISGPYSDSSAPYEGARNVFSVYLPPCLKEVNALPDVLTIYRGAHERERNRRNLGMSWTLDRETAIKFTTMLRHRTDKPVLLETQIHKADALAFIFERDEQEVLVNPATFRHRVKMTPLTPGEPAPLATVAR